MKKLSILGSTGSIGTQTLEIVKNNPSEFRVAGLTTNNNIELLKKQIQEFKPIAVAVMDEEKADFLKGDININVYSGIGGIIKIAKLNEVDTVVNSLVGSIGVKPTIEAIKNKKNIALANKETLVTAGSIVMEEIKKNNVNLMPIDSEHSAIFQCLNGENRKEVSRITLTCSGGPFNQRTRAYTSGASASRKRACWRSRRSALGSRMRYCAGSASSSCSRRSAGSSSFSSSVSPLVDSAMTTSPRATMPISP